MTHLPNQIRNIRDYMQFLQVFVHFNQIGHYHCDDGAEVLQPFLTQEEFDLAERLNDEALEIFGDYAYRIATDVMNDHMAKTNPNWVVGPT